MEWNKDKVSSKLFGTNISPFGINQSTKKIVKTLEMKITPGYIYTVKVETFNRR